MRPRFLLFATMLMFSGATAAPAAVTESQFPPNTVRDLIAICSADKNDPLMTAAVNFCHGFAEGAVIVEEAHEAQKGGRKLFCLPNPLPPRGSELTSFTAWANEQPARLDMPSIDGMFIYLAGKYPCPAETPKKRGKR
jgi:Ssp1 endopeptidase immunity protein Rap1a